MSDIYQEHILDHYSNPRNRGVIESADIYFRDSNPLCGDEIAAYALVDGKKIKKSSFLASGCAISQAAASMLSEEIEGKYVQNVEKMSASDVVSMLGIELSPTRLKCALLALKTLQAGIAIYRRKNGTT